MDCYCTLLQQPKFGMVFVCEYQRHFLKWPTATPFYCSFNHIELCASCSFACVCVYIVIVVAPVLWCLCKHFNASDLICPELSSFFLVLFSCSFHGMSVCPRFNFIYNLFVALIKAGIHSFSRWFFFVQLWVMHLTLCTLLVYHSYTI